MAVFGTFKKGVHPYGGKELSQDKPIVEIQANKELVYPLSQHIGAPARPIVEISEHVLAGQMIAEAGGFVSAPIFASVSGTVREIGMRTTLSGETAQCIVLENDDEYVWEEGKKLPEQLSLNTPYAKRKEFVGDFLKSNVFQTIENAAIIQAVKNAGVVGLGGAGFPTSVKLSPKDSDAIDYVIINGAECEPYLTSDYRLILERGYEMIAGCECILKLFPNAKCVIGIENNKPKAIQVIHELIQDHDRISLLPLKTKYPQGGERMLIYAVTHRKLNSKMLPADAGCVVVNVASSISIFRAVAFGTPLTHRIMTVTGDGVQNPCNLEVPIGVSYRDVLDAAGGFSGPIEKVISGGPMMGFAMFSLDIPVTKTSASILALKKDPIALHVTTPCVHCGKCVRACPENLLPQMLVDAADHNDFEKFEKFGGLECIECGCCAYGCPAKRHLVQSMRYGKRKTMEIVKARKAAENAAKGDIKK